ncbi:MAG: bifunctional hydroxymethylpyrimidine kinase/phosphomethylpyrimidine kinase [Halodesulfurarchaeum sp.]
MRRAPVPDERPVVLTVAGSDSGGGAGIQADLKTIEAHGGFGTSVITSVTAQHTAGVESTHVLPTQEVAAQLEAVLGDFDVRAVKTGMLATADIVDLVSTWAADLSVPLVVDPVMVAASGDRLLEPEAETAYRDLLAEATLVTPNLDEVRVLTGVESTEPAALEEAGQALLERGADAALLKGGHVPGPDVTDRLVTSDSTIEFTHARVDTEATHGSGCTLSSAIATNLATGEPLTRAVSDAVSFMERAVRYHLKVGTGPGAVHHLVGLRERAGRTDVIEAVEDVVDTLVAEDVSAVVPEVGMQVAGTTRYGEERSEVAAVEGRITRTASGIRPNRGVRMGASSHVARLLLAAREHDPTLRFAANCRLDEDVEAALDRLDWTVGTFDREDEPEPESEGHTMQWGTDRAFASVEGTPDAIVDRGAVGKEAMTRVLAEEAGRLSDRITGLAEAVREVEA